MRKTFYDLLEEIEFNASDEYKRLVDLFMSENRLYDSFYETLKDYINREIFRTLSIRKSFTSLDDMMNKLEILKEEVCMEDLFVFCEMLLSIMVVPPKATQEYIKQCITICKNIDAILEKTNYMKVEISDNDDRRIIVKKNKSAMLSAEKVTDKTLSFQILEYNHHALKGDLMKKKQILLSLGVYLEPILNSRMLSVAGYKQLESNCGFLLNKFHIRHNNKEGSKSQEYIVQIDDNTLEQWYDKTYDVMLQAIITNENLKVEKEIDNLKQAYDWRN